MHMVLALHAVGSARHAPETALTRAVFVGGTAAPAAVARTARPAVSMRTFVAATTVVAAVAVAGHAAGGRGRDATAATGAESDQAPASSADAPDPGTQTP